MKRHWMALLGLIAVALAVGGFAVAATTNTVSVCASASTPAHTVSIDGTAVSTLPGDTDSQCATTTYTIPDPVTVTVTETVTTSEQPTEQTYASATAYTQTRPAFTPTREVDVSTSSELKTAITNLQAGDLIKATAPFTVSTSSSTPLTIASKPASPAEIDLTGVTIKYTGTAQSDGVWLNNPKNLYIYGGDISTGQGATCIRVYGSQNVLWWGFHAHNCGANGFQAQAIGGPVSGGDFEGEVNDVGQNYLAWDPHPEKGTGLHGANLWDANQTNSFSNNRFAFNMHDIPVGACVEYGNDKGVAVNNTLILRCVNASFVAQTQTAGNALQLWGNMDNTQPPTLDVKYLEASNLQGYALRDAGSSAGTDESGIVVEYGRASNTNQNPRYAGDNPWQHAFGEVLQDVVPAP